MRKLILMKLKLNKKKYYLLKIISICQSTILDMSNSYMRYFKLGVFQDWGSGLFISPWMIRQMGRGGVDRASSSDAQGTGVRTPATHSTTSLPRSPSEPPGSLN